MAQHPKIRNGSGTPIRKDGTCKSWFQTSETCNARVQLIWVHGLRTISWCGERKTRRKLHRRLRIRFRKMEPDGTFLPFQGLIFDTDKKGWENDARSSWLSQFKRNYGRRHPVCLLPPNPRSDLIPYLMRDAWCGSESPTPAGGQTVLQYLHIGGMIPTDIWRLKSLQHLEVEIRILI